jgi:hypothetical protein
VDLFSLLHLQIIIDIAFFISILILLRQLDKRIAKGSYSVDVSIIDEYKKFIMDSQDSTNQFLKAVENSEHRLTRLAYQLDNKEKRLMGLIEQVEGLIKQVDSHQENGEPICSEADKYDRIIKMIQEGQGRDTVAKRIGVTEGEINLVMELEKTRTQHI